MRHLVIANAYAGGGRPSERLRALIARLATPGAQFEIALTERPGHATEIARRQAASYHVLVAAGGDGTVGEVATGILTSSRPSTPLAILPMGTGNDAALALGIRDWATAAKVLETSEVRAIDACEVSYLEGGEQRTRFSLIGVGVGFPAMVIDYASKRVKRRLGRWGYLYAVAICARSYHCPTLRITAGERIHEGLVPVCGVLNMAHSGGRSLRMAPGARFDDGWLNILLVHEPKVVRLLRYVPHVMRGTHISLPQVEYFAAREVAIASDPPSAVTIDADPAGSTPLSCRIHPSILRVKVPEQTADR